MMKPTFPFSRRASYVPAIHPSPSRMGTKSSPPPSPSPPPFRTNFLAPLVSKVCPECPDAAPARPRWPSALVPFPSPECPTRIHDWSNAGLSGFPFPDKFRCHYFGSIAFNTVCEVVQRTECGSAADGPLTNKKTFPSISPSPAFFPDLIQTMIQTNMVWALRFCSIAN